MHTPFRLRLDDYFVEVNMPVAECLLDAVRDRLRLNKGFAIATLNLDHLVKLKTSSSFRDAYKCHDFVVADGNPIVWLSWLAGTPVSLVTGSDLVEPLVALAARENASVALVGANDGVLAIAAGRLRDRYPTLRIAACIAPSNPFDPEGAEGASLIESLRESRASITLLALGAPRQEVFAARCRATLPDAGFVSVGAGLDFIAATQSRAPVIFRRFALEWLWRLLSDPRRLAQRYVLCAYTLPKVAIRVLGGASIWASHTPQGPIAAPSSKPSAAGHRPGQCIDT